MKKQLLLVVGIILISTMVFIGCGGRASDTSDPRYPINISIYHETVGGNTQPAANNPIYQYIEREFNVTFTWDLLVGDARQKQGVMIASGDYPDIVELRGNEWIEAGALIPLQDLIMEHGPRIYELYKDIWEMMKSADGNIYYLVNYGVHQGINHDPNYNQVAFYIQKEILREAGYPRIRTVDEYFNLIRDYYRRNPTINGQPTVPFAILTDDWRAFELWNPPNFLAGNPNDGNGMVNPNTYEYQAFFTLDISRRWFQLLNQLDKEGLIDRTSFTDTYDQYMAKVAAGRLLGHSIQGWQFQSFDNANRDRGENNRTMAPLAVTFDASIQPWYRNRDIPNLLRGMGITTSAQDPVRIIRFINELLEERHQRTIHWGIEGEHWQWGPNNVPYRTEAQRANWQNQQWQRENRGLLLGDIFPKIQGSFSDGNPSDIGFLLSEREATLLPEDLELFAAYGVSSYNALIDPNPRPNYPWFPTWNMEYATPPDGSAAQIALARMEQIMKQRLPQMILAPTAQFSTLWDQYVAEMEAAGLATYNAHMQAELNKRLIEWNIRR